MWDSKRKKWALTIWIALLLSSGAFAQQYSNHWCYIQGGYNAQSLWGEATDAEKIRYMSAYEDTVALLLGAYVNNGQEETGWVIYHLMLDQLHNDLNYFGWDLTAYVRAASRFWKLNRGDTNPDTLDAAMMFGVNVSEY